MGVPVKKTVMNAKSATTTAVQDSVKDEKLIRKEFKVCLLIYKLYFDVVNIKANISLKTMMP